MSASGRRIAIVDPGSFVLPYDYQLVKALAARGDGVDFHGSLTRYNGAFIDAMRALPNVTVRALAISGTVASRVGGLLAYARLVLRLLRGSKRHAIVNLQFSAFWPLDLLLAFGLGRRFVFTVHNAVPHGFRGRRHRPTQWLAARASRLVFVSEATRADFLDRYGRTFVAKADLLPHGLLPIAPGLAATPYGSGADSRTREPTLVFWGTVQPYKGCDLFVPLATSAALRERGLAFEVHGAWDESLLPLLEQLRELGVTTQADYLDADRLAALLSRDAVFLLPYQTASQSGALYALLNHGRLFICSDVGDLGHFMRRFGLDGLLMRDHSVDAVLACLDHLSRHRPALLRAFQAAQDACDWNRLLAAASPQAYREAP